MGRVASCVAGLLVAPLLAWAVQAPTAVPKKASPRRLVHPADPRDLSPAVRPHVERLLAADQAPVDPAAAGCGGVYLRIVSRQHAVDGGGVKDGAWLGSRPAVFLTVPEAAYGRSLLQTFSAIGYDPEDVLESEAGVEKVAVVFAYPHGGPPSDTRDGRLSDGWERRVHPATWDNLFALAERLAADADRVALRPEPGAFTPTKLRLGSERERLFLLGFPDAGRERVRATPYGTLQTVGGADWEYRQLLERTLGASEHFRGDGRTKLTLAGRRRSRDGFPEFLGPNAELRTLPALAVVSLGALRIADE